MSLLYPTAKCFARSLEKGQDFAKWKDVEGSRESWFPFSQTDIKSSTELKILSLSDSFMGAELIAEWENRHKKFYIKEN